MLSAILKINVGSADIVGVDLLHNKGRVLVKSGHDRIVTLSYQFVNYSALERLLLYDVVLTHDDLFKAKTNQLVGDASSELNTTNWKRYITCGV